MKSETAHCTNLAWNITIFAFFVRGSVFSPYESSDKARLRANSNGCIDIVMAVWMKDVDERESKGYCNSHARAFAYLTSTCSLNSQQNNRTERNHKSYCANILHLIDLPQMNYLFPGIRAMLGIPSECALRQGSWPRGPYPSATA